MLEIFLWGVLSGAVATAIAAFFVWRNNKRKIENYVDWVDGAVEDALDEIEDLEVPKGLSRALKEIKKTIGKL